MCYNEGMENKMILFLSALVSVVLPLGAAPAGKTAIDLSRIPDVRIFKGDETVAYRDPAVHFENGVFHLFFTVCDPAKMVTTLAYSTSRDLVTWTPPRDLLPRDQKFNYSSPGNVVVDGDERVLCLQTYPTPGARAGQVVWGDATCRLITMRTTDFVSWSAPEIIRVKGPKVPTARMGRMIDPYLIRDPGGLWHCFYKHCVKGVTGASHSVSRDLKSWREAGFVRAGENVCILPADDGTYVMLHSPENGIGVKRSADLMRWTETDHLVLGQKDWPWAKGRLTAATVLDGRRLAGVGKYLMFFHGSGPKKELQGDMWKNASIGIAWSDDLKVWSWPGKKDRRSVREKTKRAK